MLRWFICWIALLLSPLVLAESTTDPRAQLERFADGLETLSGSFRQVIYDSDGFVLEESAGRVYFQSPDRFRWDYVEPFPQQLVADGEHLWHFDESLDQVTVRAQPDAAASPLLVLTRPDLLDRFYRIEQGERDHALRFAPLEPDAGFERASLHFVDDRPVELELVDSLVGQTTWIRLQDLERNPQLADGLFRFEPPAGVDVLEGY